MCDMHFPAPLSANSVLLEIHLHDSGGARDDFKLAGTWVFQWHPYVVSHHTESGHDFRKSFHVKFLLVLLIRPGSRFGASLSQTYFISSFTGTLWQETAFSQNLVNFLCFVFTYFYLYCFPLSKLSGLGLCS